jgi:glutamate-1-semialdehyde aminotransferase
LKKNNIILQRTANEKIAHGALTNSKRPECLLEGVYPTHISDAYKCYLNDVDGNRYIDFICGLGTNLFGYGNYKIIEAVKKMIDTGGSVFSLASGMEVIFAEKFIDEHPFIDRVRFLKSGSEGCSAAIRIARAYTGRSLVLTEGYHGWHDDFVQITPPAVGVAPNNQMGILTDLSLAKIKKPAAIIIEPVNLEFNSERIAWLQKLRDICDEHKICLIYDETITAYRFKAGSVAKATNIYPDLWIGGKAIGGGYPLSVVGGKKDVMEASYFVSSTWAGDRIPFAAGIASIELMHNNFKSDDLWNYGSVFLERFNKISSDVKIHGYPTRGVFKYSSLKYQALFMQEMCKAGILIGPSWFYNKFLHEEMDHVISCACEIDRKIRNSYVKLEGKPPVSPFSKKVRECSKT